MLIASTKAATLIILSLGHSLMATLIARYPFAVAARSLSSFRSNPQSAIAQPVPILKAWKL